MNLPCKDCILFPICLSKFDNDDDPVFSFNVLTDKCSSVNDYLTYQDSRKKYIISDIEYGNRIDTVLDFYSDPYSDSL